MGVKSVRSKQVRMDVFEYSRPKAICQSRVSTRHRDDKLELSAEDVVAADKSS